jgi:hypothetical protein
VPEEDYLDEIEDMDLAQKPLRAMVHKLSRHKTIPKDVQTILLKLSISRDDRIMAAFDHNSIPFHTYFLWCRNLNCYPQNIFSLTTK